MITRLTGLLLVLCIGLPMCWCCIGGELQEQTSSCCASEHQPEPDSKKDNCPCANHENKRDLVADTAKAPGLELRLLGTLLWATSDPFHPVVAADLDAAHPDHGPPGNAPPLYQRHCALLI